MFSLIIIAHKLNHRPPNNQTQHGIIYSYHHLSNIAHTAAIEPPASILLLLFLHQSIFVPTLTYGHELWVVTERTRSRVQAAEMSFLRRVAGLSLRDRVRSSVIREELGVDPLLLHIERSQMKWLGQLGCLPDASLVRCSGQVPLVGDPGEDPGHAGETMSLGWPGNASGSLRKSWT